MFQWLEDMAIEAISNQSHDAQIRRRQIPNNPIRPFSREGYPLRWIMRFMSLFRPEHGQASSQSNTCITKHNAVASEC
jgi:hypothetical protein